MIDLPPSVSEHEEIESLAYRLYVDEGKPDGRADEHWIRAEQFIHAEASLLALLRKNQMLSNRWPRTDPRHFAGFGG